MLQMWLCNRARWVYITLTTPSGAKESKMNAQTQTNVDDLAGTAEIARKLQAKAIVGNVKKFVPALDDSGNPTTTVTPLFQIWGHASDVKRGEGDHGPWVALLGRFEAINLTMKKVTTKNEAGAEVVTESQDGRMFAGPMCFLPEPMNSMLATQLEAVEQETDADGKGVLVNGEPKMRRLVDSLEFAFEIGVRATATPVGYEYTTKPIIKAGGADPLAALRRRVLAPQLAPPATQGASNAAQLEVQKAPPADVSKGGGNKGKK